MGAASERPYGGNGLTGRGAAHLCRGAACRSLWLGAETGAASGAGTAYWLDERPHHQPNR
jgi:hypothetical protein